MYGVLTRISFIGCGVKSDRIGVTMAPFMPQTTTRRNKSQFQKENKTEMRCFIWRSEIETSRRMYRINTCVTLSSKSYRLYQSLAVFHCLEWHRLSSQDLPPLSPRAQLPTWTTGLRTKKYQRSIATALSHKQIHHSIPEIRQRSGNDLTSTVVWVAPLT